MKKFKDLKYNDVFFQLIIEESKNTPNTVKYYYLKIFKVVSSYIGQTWLVDGNTLYISGREIAPNKKHFFENYSIAKQYQERAIRSFKNYNQTILLISDKDVLKSNLKDLNRYNTLKGKKLSPLMYKEICNQWQITKEILTKVKFFTNS